MDLYKVVLPDTPDLCASNTDALDKVLLMKSRYVCFYQKKRRAQFSLTVGSKTIEMDGAKMEHWIEDPPKHKHKGTPLLAVMDENSTSCAGAPLCEPHCPVEGCINLLYEEAIT